MVGVERVQTIKRSIYGYISILTQYMNEIIDIACFQDFIYEFIIHQSREPKTIKCCICNFRVVFAVFFAY